MTEITSLDEAGIALMAELEGCILHPYKDAGGIPTIGIGMTYYPGTGKRVTMTDEPITLAQAHLMFAAIAKPIELAVYSTTRHDLTQNQFNACFALAYNIGNQGFKNSTVHTLINQYVTGERLKEAWCMWRKVAGKDNADLLARRIKEFNLYSA